MNKQEAVQAIKSGKKVTHSWFSSDEWMTRGTILAIQFEDGVECSFIEFFAYRDDESWDDGYSIYDELDETA